MNEIRIGRVSSVNYKQGTVDVVFQDKDFKVMVDLPLFSSEYQMPSVNDLVTVIFQIDSNHSAQGYIVGKPYSSDNLPEHTGKGVYFKRFGRNAYMKYDSESDTLHIHAGKVVIDGQTNHREGA